MLSFPALSPGVIRLPTSYRGLTVVAYLHEGERRGQWRASAAAYDDRPYGEENHSVSFKLPGVYRSKKACLAAIVPLTQRVIDAYLGALP